MSNEEESVLESNKNFYRAIQSLDLSEMESIWLPEEWVRCVHPGWDLIEGWEAIRESWQRIFKNTRYLRVSVSLQSVRVENSQAWVCCTEKIFTASEGRFENAHVQATNIFLLSGGAWYLVHHHGSHLPPSNEEEESEMVQ